MADQRALLQAVLDNPDDDAPRAAFAAACETDDPDYAAFIRYQLALARAGAGNPDRVRLYTEANELLADHGRRWSGAFGRAVPNYTFRRGFIEHIGINSDDFVQHWARLLAAAPIRHVDFLGTAEDLPALLQCEGLRRLHSMSLDGWSLRDDAMPQLCRCPYLDGLRWLSLADNHFTRAGARVLAAAARLPALRYVNFSGNPVDLEERFAVDQGVVLEAWLSDDGKALEEELGTIAWLHSGAETVLDYPPGRFTV